MKSFVSVAMALALAAAVFPRSASAQGYQVQPMMAQISPSGSRSTVRLAIRNTGSVPITLEMEPFRASVNEAGVPTRSAEERDLIVFPPQTIVQPGREQAVQVRYVGDASLAEARIYGVRVSQLPVNFGAGTGTSGAEADVKVSFNFLTHIVVSPEGAQSQVEVSDVARRPDGAVGMTLRNQGNAVVILNDYRWEVRDGSGRAVELTTDKVNLGEFSALLPNQARQVSIPAAELGSMQGPVQVSLRTR